MATITSPRPQSPASTSRNVITSPSLTPSSSVRHSFDFSSTTSSNGRSISPAPGTTGLPAQRRNRAALRDYYNLKSKPASASSPQLVGPLSRTGSIASVGSESTVTSAAADTGLSASALPAALDDPSFDAEAYVHTMLHTASLRETLKIESALVSEIRQLDGERKALVYDNYSKLIAATRTIGRMQQSLNAEGGLRNVEELKGRVEGIERVAQELGREGTRGKGDEKRKRDNRKEEREKRELVRWVVEAPGRFEALIAEGKAEEVEKEWDVVKALLEKWDGVKGVKDVRVACQQIVGGIELRDEEEGG